MLGLRSTSKQGHVVQLLLISKLSLLQGKFKRQILSDRLGLQPHIIEGRWYGEIKRTSKYGEQHDWRTQLNSMVQRQLSSVAKVAWRVRTICKLLDRLIEILASPAQEQQDICRLVQATRDAIA